MGFVGVFKIFCAIFDSFKELITKKVDKIHAYLLNDQEPPRYSVSLIIFETSYDIKNSLISFWGPIWVPGTLRVNSLDKVNCGSTQGIIS